MSPPLLLGHCPIFLTVCQTTFYLGKQHTPVAHLLFVLSLHRGDVVLAQCARPYTNAQQRAYNLSRNREHGLNSVPGFISLLLSDLGQVTFSLLVPLFPLPLFFLVRALGSLTMLLCSICHNGGLILAGDHNLRL